MNADNTIETPDSNEPMGRPEWALTTLALLFCAGVGYVGAAMVGFPYYRCFQGALVQQPLAGAGGGLVGMVGVVLVGVQIAKSLTERIHLRMGFCIGMVSLLGFSLRGGTVGSVMEAAGGSEIFWALAGELLGLTILTAGVYAVYYRGHKPAGQDDATKLAMGVLAQAVTVAVVMLILGKSDQKLQATMAVLAASTCGSLAGLAVAGRVWRYGWCVPMAVGVAGYLVNAMTATGVDTADLKGGAVGLAMALPLDYVAMGPVGTLLGEIIARHQGEPAPVVI